MSNDGNIEGLRSTLLKGDDALGETQSALGVAKDRLDKASYILKQGTQGSNNDSVASALACIEATHQIIDQAIEATMLGKQHLDAYGATR